jgi:hypothetical protein
MVNELEMSSEDVAIALGHQDGGNLVRRLYGHRYKGCALDRIIGAYATRVENHPSARDHQRERLRRRACSDVLDL